VRHDAAVAMDHDDPVRIRLQDAQRKRGTCVRGRRGRSRPFSTLPRRPIQAQLARLLCGGCGAGAVAGLTFDGPEAPHAYSMRVG